MLGIVLTTRRKLAQERDAALKRQNEAVLAERARIEEKLLAAYELGKRDGMYRRGKKP